MDDVPEASRWWIDLAIGQRPALRGWLHYPIDYTGVLVRAVSVLLVWDSASFQEEHRDELGAHARNGVQFQFVMVGVPDRVLVRVPVDFDHAQG
jgi:hypothetical protein